MSTAKCPRDGAELQQGTFHKIALLHCPECDGVLVQQSSLHPLLTEMAKELYQDITFDQDIDPVPDKGAHVDCPRCQLKMENYGYMGGTRVMIDCCGQCMGLWIDTNELAVMCFLNERANKRMTHYRAAAREHLKQLDKHNIQDIMHSAFVRGFIIGAIVF